jgi:hydrogenase-4 component F
MEVLLLLLTPIVSIVLIGLFFRDRKWVEIIGMCASLIELFLAIIITCNVVMNGAYVTIAPYFRIDSFGAIILLLAGIVGSVTTFYSVEYLHIEMEKKMITLNLLKASYALMQMFLLALFVAITTAQPIVMWIAIEVTIEVTTISTAFLIAGFNRDADIEAGWKYLIINFVGLLLALLGTILFITATGTNGFNSWEGLKQSLAHADPALVRMAFIFIIIGYGTKMGLVPIHTWKPDTYQKGLLPIVALLASSVLNVAFLAIVRFRTITDLVAGPTYTHNLFIFFGIISVVLPALIMFSQRNFKRMLF